MTYQVFFTLTGEKKGDPTDLPKALHEARSLAKWNHPCHVIETTSGVIVFVARAHQEKVVA